jgi:hypothetical protein
LSLDDIVCVIFGTFSSRAGLLVVDDVGVCVIIRHRLSVHWSSSIVAGDRVLATSSGRREVLHVGITVQLRRGRATCLM